MTILKYISKTQVLLFAAAMILFVSSVNAGDLANKLYKESGMQTQLKSMSGAFGQEMGKYSQQIPENILKDMVKMGKTSFDEPTLGKIITAQLDEKLSKDQMKKVLDWHASKLAKKITKLENDAATPEGQQKMMAYAQQLATKQPEQAYVGQVQQLATASKAVEIAVEIAANLQFSMGAAMAMVSSNQEPVNLEAIAAEIEKAKPQLQQQMAQFIMVNMLYTYQGLSEKEIKSYIDFVSSPLGQSYYAAVYSGIDKAFVKAGKSYGKALGQYFEGMDKQKKS